MPDPILVEVTRGRIVESVHRGAIAISDAAGRLVFALGEYDRPVYPRSAMKPLQAIPLVASGAADRCGFGNAELALACASHNGEAEQISTAASMLAATGCDVSALECGPHWPKREADVATLHRAGRTPDALYNNCSGKHAGFLCLARHLGVDHHGYCDPGHPVQRQVMAVLTAFTETLIEPGDAGIDGCSAPNWPIPLDALAMAFARFCTGLSIEHDRAKAAERLLAACAAEPFMVAGTDRFCTKVMTTLGARAFVKTGAEGVFCAALPRLGLGIALKCADGAVRASEVMMATLVAALVAMTAEEEAAIAPLVRPKVKNWNGVAVGEIRPSADFVKRLDGARRA